jgi:hypothetical protein
MSLAPNPHLYRGHLIFGDPSRAFTTVAGFRVEFPETSLASDDTHLRLERDLAAMLSALSPLEKAQFHFYTCGSLSRELDAFHDRTVEAARVGQSPTYVTGNRIDLVNWFRHRQQTGKLLRARCLLYLSTQATPVKKDAAGFERSFGVAAARLEQHRQAFNALLQAYGGSVTRLDDEGLWFEHLTFCCPLTARTESVPHNLSESAAGLGERCNASGVSRSRDGAGFVRDQHHFAALAVKTTPPATTMKSAQGLTTLAFSGLRVTVNVTPRTVESELERQQKRHDRLKSNVTLKHENLAVEEGLKKPRAQTELLSKNEVLPYAVQFIVTLHDRDPKALSGKVEAVKMRLGQMRCQVYEACEPAHALSYYHAATPGNAATTYNDYSHALLDRNLVHLLPAASSPEGDLENADFLIDNWRDGLAGFSFWEGSKPRDVVAIGPKGSGKSTNLMWILSQCVGYGFGVVVDDGGSWEGFCRALDPNSRPIRFDPNNPLTSNPFDTENLPLSFTVISDAAALCLLLSGSSGDALTDRAHLAFYSETIQKLYDRAYESFRFECRAQHYELAKEAWTILAYRDAHPADSLSDAYAAVKALQKGSPASLIEFQAPNDAALQRMEVDSESREALKNLAFTRFERERYPTLSSLRDALKVRAAQESGEARVTLTNLCRLLGRWVRRSHGGSEEFGPLLDGPSTVSFGSPYRTRRDPLKILHFELSALSTVSRELAAVVGFAVTSKARRLVEQMPRGIRKFWVGEELTTFLSLPNGPEVVRDLAERSRKYSLQNFWVFQQFSSLSTQWPPAATALMAASELLFLFKNNEHDLRCLNRHGRVTLPDAVIEQVTGFAGPESQKGRQDRHGCVCVVDAGGREARATLCKIFLTEAQEQLFGSGGDRHEQRQQALSNHEKIIPLPPAA